MDSGARKDAFSQLQIAFLRWRRFLQSGLRPYGITLKQVFVLQRLAEVEYLNPSRIASLLFAARPTATVILGNMERQGWIQRERDPQNKKYHRIRITSGGRSKLEEIREHVWPDGGGPPDPLQGWSDGERETLTRLLRKLNRDMRQIIQSTVSDETL